MSTPITLIIIPVVLVIVLRFRRRAWNQSKYVTINTGEKNKEELWAIVDEIFWKDWDPIGVNGEEAARDEYYSYIPAIVGMVTANASAQEIAEQLYIIETKSMGLRGNNEKCKMVADKIMGTCK